MKEIEAFFNTFKSVSEPELLRITSLFNAVPIPCCIFDRCNNIRFYNHAMLDFFSLSSGQGNIDNIKDISPEYQPDGVSSEIKSNELIKKAFQCGEVTFEWMHRKSCGLLIPVRITLVRMIFQEDSVVLSFFFDLREINKLEQKMREAYNRMSVMYDSVPLICNYFDSKLNLIDCNIAAVELFDLSCKKEYIDRFYDLSPIYQPCGELSTKKSRRLLKNVFSSGRSNFSWVHQKLNGELIPVDVTLVTVKTENNVVVIGYAHDLRTLDSMEKLANRDDLTGLYNRRYCVNMLSELLDKGNNFSVCFIDIDELKIVNDRLGHISGDNYIKFVASKLIKRIRKDDVLCRVGGDEFVLILFNLSKEESEEVLMDVCSSIVSSGFSHLTSISYGIVCSDVKHTVDSILHEADSLMYECKRQRKLKKNFILKEIQSMTAV